MKYPDKFYSLSEQLKYLPVSILFCVLLFAGCKQRQTDAQTAFYYWKTTLELDSGQTALLKHAAEGRLYLRLFDVAWDAERGQALPNAIVSIRQPLKGLKICPVIYLTNKTFEKTKLADADSLAFRVNELLKRTAAKNQFNYQAIQIDCDWTAGTRERYFAFLKAFKKYSQQPLEATIRLHQIKYPDKTGIPPVDKGLLMFYNMGKISASLKAGNSIYNAEDAEKYLATLSRYPLPLDLALPIFSWAIHIREGRVIQLYGKIGRKQLEVTTDFEIGPGKNVYRAIHSFYLEGLYLQTGDLLKLEEINLKELNQAAKQVSGHMAPLKKRNIIYYELSTINLSSLSEKDFQEVSAHF